MNITVIIQMKQPLHKKHKMVPDDIDKVHKLTDKVGISKSAIHHMLTDYLDMRKLCAAWNKNVVANTCSVIFHSIYSQTWRKLGKSLHTSDK